MNKPYSHPEAINPAVTHDAVVHISITLLDYFFAYLFTKLKLEFMFSYLFDFM